MNMYVKHSQQTWYLKVVKSFFYYGYVCKITTKCTKIYVIVSRAICEVPKNAFDVQRKYAIFRAMQSAAVQPNFMQNI